MRSSFRRRLWQLAFVFATVLAVVLSACGTSSSSGGSGSTSSSQPGKGVSLTVGSKLDPDGQLLGEMYVLLLQHAGYTVTPKLALGQTPVLQSAIQSGAVDLYPEFTGTAITVLNLPATQNPQQAYQEVKSAYEQRYQITWLDPAYNLNDSYAICTSPSVAQKYHLKSISDLAPIANQFTIASPQDGVSAAVDPVQNAYGFKFKKIAQFSEPLGFGAVQQGSAQVNVCYTTDPAIVVNHFVTLTDSKQVFPIYNPAPIVRDSTLKKSPAIAATLNPLADKLTTDKQLALIKQVAVDHKPLHDVALAFLQQEGLLPK